jgi:hypothetical protein
VAETILDNRESRELSIAPSFVRNRAVDQKMDGNISFGGTTQYMNMNEAAWEELYLTTLMCSNGVANTKYMLRALLTP